MRGLVLGVLVALLYVFFIDAEGLPVFILIGLGYGVKLLYDCITGNVKYYTRRREMWGL